MRVSSKISNTNKVEVYMLIEKLSNMSKQGSEEGERSVAKLKLNQICMKYGIEYEDGDDLTPKPRCFKYVSIESKKVLSQCIFEVIKGVEVRENYLEKNLIAISSFSDYIEINKIYKKYWDTYKKERKLLLKNFTHSFIEENNIGLKK